MPRLIVPAAQGWVFALGLLSLALPMLLLVIPLSVLGWLRARKAAAIARQREKAGPLTGRADARCRYASASLASFGCCAARQLLGSADLHAIPAQPCDGMSDKRCHVPADSVQPLDQARLRELRSMIGEARLDNVLGLFAGELEERSRSVRDALADRAVHRALAEAHALQTAARHLGAARVASVAARLQRGIMAAAAGDGTQLAPALRALAAAVGETRGALAARNPARTPATLCA